VAEPPRSRTGFLLHETCLVSLVPTAVHPQRVVNRGSPRIRSRHGPARTGGTERATPALRTSTSYLPPVFGAWAVRWLRKADYIS
jgi:hypothetical protein